MVEKGYHTYQEIMSQSEVWSKVIRNLDGQLRNLNDWIKIDHDEVVFTGCGSTHYLSLSAAKIWSALTHQSSRGLPSSEIWFYEKYNFSKMNPLLVAVSRSGETSETIQAINSFKKRYNSPPLVIGCYPESNLVKMVDLRLVAPEAQELSVAQTRSFSSMYLMCLGLAGYVAQNTQLEKELEQLPRINAELVNKYEAIIREIGTNPKFQHFVFLGSGHLYGIASEVMLKMKEMSTSVSEVFHFMEYRHGPMSMITENSLVIGLLSDNNKDEELKVLQDMGHLGATTLALGNQVTSTKTNYQIEFNSSISEMAKSLLFLPLLQLLGYYHSISKGLNPDRPTNLSAVVVLDN